MAIRHGAAPVSPVTGAGVLSAIAIAISRSANFSAILKSRFGICGLPQANLHFWTWIRGSLSGGGIYI
jgi:hypothetical protein